MEVGRYNITIHHNGAYDNGIPYALVIIEEFDDNNHYIEESKHTLYFRTGCGYLLPQFRTEDDVRALLRYRPNTKLAVTVSINIEEVKP